MAIPAASLKLRSGDSSLVGNNGSMILQKTWEVYHATLGDTIKSGRVSHYVAVIGQFPAADVELEQQCEAHLGGVQEWHKAIGAIGGYSAWDADLILDSWMQDEDGMHHPICGDIAENPADIVDRVNDILGICPGPPTWFWAEATANPGELRVKCVAVAGVDSYNVYNGETLIGNVATEAWQTIGGLTAGTYSVREAGVDSGQVGILSFAIEVEVS